MKLWDKGQRTSANVEEFTVGRDREFDMYLASYDILGSIAHTMMLQECGLLTLAEGQQLVQELRTLMHELESGEFHIPEHSEDVHSYVEELLTLRCGDVGKKVHTARSRNDQVCVDMKLYLRDYIIAVHNDVMNLATELLRSAEKYKDVVLPGYTHFQIAMPSSFGLWFGAYAESLADDIEMLVAAYTIVNKNPLGSAAGYGTSFPIQRSRTTELLGFGEMNVSSVYAQMTRGKSEKATAVAIATIATTLSKLAYDVCLYSSQNFGFVRLPADATTGSSIMPHKNNPDVFELIRARSNRLQALPNEVTMVINNLPSGYHRDMQILKEIVLPACEELQRVLTMTRKMISLLHIQTDIVQDEKYDLMYSVDAVHEKVRSGRSFRDAYKEVGEHIVQGTFRKPEALHHTHEGSIGNPGLEMIAHNLQKTVAKIDVAAVRKAEQMLLGDSYEGRM